MAISIIKKSIKILSQRDIVNVTGKASDWVYINVVFPKSYSKTPLVTVNAPYDTGSGTNWTLPMLKRISTTGFTFGWYNASGSKDVIWQAIGEV